MLWFRLLLIGLKWSIFKKNIVICLLMCLVWDVVILSWLKNNCWLGNSVRGLWNVWCWIKLFMVFCWVIFWLMFWMVWIFLFWVSICVFIFSYILELFLCNIWILYGVVWVVFDSFIVMLFWVCWSDFGGKMFWMFRFCILVWL